MPVDSMCYTLKGSEVRGFLVGKEKWAILIIFKNINSYSMEEGVHSGKSRISV